MDHAAVKGKQGAWCQRTKSGGEGRRMWRRPGGQMACGRAERLFTPSPLGDIKVLPIGIRARSLISGFTAWREIIDKSALSEDVFKTIMPLEDAHLIWTTLKERHDKSKSDGDDTLVEASFGDCSTSSPHHDKSQVIISSDQEGLTPSYISPTCNYEQESTPSICSSSIAEDHLCFMGDDDDSVVDHLNKTNTTMVIKLMRIIEK
uniref:OSJNBb0058J09.9 protein n=1 Tax=Oryza sativa subsp. japonica TaxID=39947 RepID=Q7XWX0_ORYSJ|nr:OSJNBb0058J09.9 [Oryza sativa Japonica Group]